jgi:uncharacterized protein YjbJ (UPF0337 family)
MNDDELKGKMKNLKGRAKEAFGSMTGNKSKQAEGTAERIGGAVQEKAGKVKKEISEDEDIDVERDDEDEPREP